MQLPLSDRVIQTLQRNGVAISTNLASRVHGICQARGTDPWTLQRLLVSYLGAHTFEPLSDFMCRHSLTMEELKKFTSPKSTAHHGFLAEPDFERLYAKDTNSSHIRSCYASCTSDQEAQLTSDLKKLLSREWLVRFILGYGAAEWRDLKQARRNIQQAGDDDRLPWSKAKHLANVCFIGAAIQTGLLPKVPLVFETCQGKGDATEKYRESTVVVSTESDPARHTYATQRTGSASLTTFAPHSVQLGQVFTPDEPMSAQEAVRYLQTIGAQFDIVDIDPFGSSLNILLACLPIMKSRALVMLTLGDAANAPHGFDTVASSIGLNLKSFPSSILGHVKDRLTLVTAYRYLVQAADAGVLLKPLLYLKAIQYHRHRVTIDGKRQPVAGVDRLYCLAIKNMRPQEAREELSNLAVEDPFIGRTVLWPGHHSPFSSVDFYLELWDKDNCRLRETGLAAMRQRIFNVCVSATKTV